jgi:hypothetical protein
MGAGRPLIFSTPQEMESKINQYFNGGCRTKTILVGKEKEPFEVPVPTISGLAIFLGFESRQSFYDYEEYSEFSYTVKRARLFIEREYEEQLQSGNVTGAIFALKNFGWIDRSEVKQEVQVTEPVTFRVISKDANN